MNPLLDPRKRSILMMAVAFLATFLGLMTAFALVGKEARHVDVLTLFFTAFGAGASLIDAIVSIRRSPRSAE